MSNSAALKKCWQAINFRACKNRALDHSSSYFTRQIAKISAAALVVASAGFGSVYAWSTGSQHGMLVGSLSVLMAVALEAAKPLAFASALAALCSFRLVRGFAMLLLAAVSITYSLTAELSLLAGARGDAVATREASIKATAGVEAEATRARERYELAKAEHAGLPVTGSIAELQSQIDALLLTPGTNGCLTIDGAVTRSICPKVSELRIELGRSQRRAELETIMAQPIPVTPSGQHEVRAADPAATALSVYLSALGIVISASLLTEWLGLIPVLALEVGSALAGVLVISFDRVSSLGANDAGGAAGIASSQVSKPKQKRGRRDDDPPGSIRGKSLQENVVDLLQRNGGTMEAGQRRLGRLLGISKSRVGQIIHELAASGAIVLDTSPSGTRLALT